mmetsp:Transcript_27548/g.69734  ORF Transcript_27548/g.69734 Transcript_27548/m.69734 type:complete len:213 (-) Transcript_27548:2346-2984(-)
MYTRFVLGSGQSEPYSCTYMAKKQISCPCTRWKARMHLERYGNSFWFLDAFESFCAETAEPISSILLEVSMLETTRTMTGAHEMPCSLSSAARFFSRISLSLVSGSSAALGMTSSLGSALARVSRHSSQKKRQSSGVSSPLYSAHVQCSHAWHSSHCTQLSTYSGRSFSFFSTKRSIETVCVAPPGSRPLPAPACTSSASFLSGWGSLRVSA